MRSIITVLSQICEIENIAIYYKKKRLISVFCKILKELKNSQESQDSLLQLSRLLMYVFAKIGFKRRKLLFLILAIYRDYMFKKSIPDKVTDIFSLFYQKDLEIIKSFSIYCFFSIRTTDHKTYYWTRGIVNYYTEIIKKLINDTNKITDETYLEYATLALYNLSLDNCNLFNKIFR